MTSAAGFDVRTEQRRIQGGSRLDRRRSNHDDRFGRARRADGWAGRTALPTLPSITGDCRSFEGVSG